MKEYEIKMKMLVDMDKVVTAAIFNPYVFGCIFVANYANNETIYFYVVLMCIVDWHFIMAMTFLTIRF